MDPKTARDYLRDPRLPNERKKDRTWRTRSDPFTEVWEEVRELVATNPGLEAKTLMEALQRKYPGQFADGQVRTLQRRLKHWRATDGPEREVFFAQQHVAGRLGQSDFTRMNELGITIGAQSFPHMLYHFVLTYSNWEAVTLCYSESFESLSDGLQNALWELGARAAGTPDRPDVVGGQQRERRAGVHDALRGPDAPLQDGGAEDSDRQTE